METEQITPGEGWRLLAQGEPLQEGDGFKHPDWPHSWLDYACRGDMFRGIGAPDSWYYVPKNDTAHIYPWRRKISPSPVGLQD